MAAASVLWARRMRIMPPPPQCLPSSACGPRWPRRSRPCHDAAARGAGKARRSRAAVGVAAPGTGTGAGRIDQHAVEGAGLALQPFAVVAVERAALDIVGAGAAQAQGRALEAVLVDVHGDDAALVVHAGGDGERLA